MNFNFKARPAVERRRPGGGRDPHAGHVPHDGARRARGHRLRRRSAAPCTTRSTRSASRSVLGARFVECDIAAASRAVTTVPGRPASCPTTTAATTTGARSTRSAPRSCRDELGCRAMDDVLIAGAGMTRFAKSTRSLRDLAGEAVRAALDDAGVEVDALDAAYVGNGAAGLVTGQEMIRGQVMLRPVGIEGIPIFNVENACASASSALHLGWQAVAAGMHDVVLCLGRREALARGQDASAWRRSGPPSTSRRRPRWPRRSAAARRTPPSDRSSWTSTPAWRARTCGTRAPPRATSPRSSSRTSTTARATRARSTAAS